MRGPKLTALLSSFSLLLILSSCDRDTQNDTNDIVRAKGVIINGAQSVPANTSAGTGTLDLVYSKATKTLTYTFNWSGLSGPAIAGNIHGLASRGTVALPPPLGTYASGVAQVLWSTSAPKGAAGSYSGTLLVDGVVIKEDDLLAGKYYVNIVTQARPTGEIRGQIEF
ncbi:MAG: CHRD domain-containing protein [Chitinophagaceae bacterium]|nr:CHRD domain-containing protein [Chitinophagaceae bacterium]